MLDLLVFYGSYRRDRLGFRLARYVKKGLSDLQHSVELIDAAEVGLPMLDRMYKEYREGEAPETMTKLARRISAAHGFVFVVGEYNWGVQPGLKNLTDHFLEEWFWRPAAVVSYSSGRIAGARANVAWHSILSEMGMVVISSTLMVGPIEEALDSDGREQGPAGLVLSQAFSRFAADLEWWADAAIHQRSLRAPPY